MNYQPEPIEYRVLSIDAGSRTGLGLAISTFRPLAMTVEHVSTVKPLMLQKDQLDPMDRYDIIQDVLMKMIREWKVSEVVVEDIFCNPRLVLAYRSLVLTHNAVRLAIRDTLGSEMHLIRANVAKTAVGVPNNNGDKSLINKALRVPREDLIIPTELGLPYLDEHSNDAVAIGYAFYRARNYGCKTDH